MPTEKGNRGAVSVEQALVVLLIALLAAAGLGFIGGTVSGWFGDTSEGFDDEPDRVTTTVFGDDGGEPGDGGNGGGGGGSPDGDVDGEPPPECLPGNTTGTTAPECASEEG